MKRKKLEVFRQAVISQQVQNSGKLKNGRDCVVQTPLAFQFWCFNWLFIFHKFHLAASFHPLHPTNILNQIKYSSPHPGLVLSAPDVHVQTLYFHHSVFAAVGFLKHFD